MKYRLTCIVFSVFLILSGISPALGASTGAHSANTTVATPGDAPGVDPPLPARGMPGWPVPDKPIPYHKPGHPSKAGSYNTQVTRMSAQGTEETVALTGLDALMADGVMNDPLQGNYRLVDLDKILVHEGKQIRSFSALYGTVSSPPEVIPGSTWTFTGDVKDVAAGDLNGDGQDEQISAWVDSENNLKLSIGEMPGSLGKATSAPAAVAHSDGKMDLLVRGYDQSLWHLHYDGSAWGEWHNAGGLLISAPAIASRGDGAFDAFAFGVDNLIYSQHWDGSDWSGDWVMVDHASYWVQYSAMPGPAVPMPADVDAPGAAARGTAQLDLFRRAPDNTLHWRHSDDGSSWGNWQNLGGVITSAPSAVSTDADHLQVFARGVDGALWHRTYSGGRWGGWARLEMPTDVRIASAPTAVSPRGSDRINVYVRGSSDRLWRIQSVGSSWGSWQVEDEGSKSTTGMFQSGALQFDGSDDYVAANSVVDDLDAGSVSFGGWVRPETDSGEQEALFGFHTASGDNLDILFYLPDSDKFSFYSPQAYESSTRTFAPDDWYHVLVVLDNAGNGTLYVDGIEETSFTTNYRPASDGRFSIGQEWDGTATSDFFAGRIDEVVVFDRVLSADEITILSDGPWDGMDGVVLGLHMDEPEATHGTTLEDASGLENHGTLYTYAPLVSGVGAAAWGDAVDLFALGYDGSLLHNRFDGSPWAGWANWGGLPPCCQTSDTGIDSPVDLDITTGHFTGDGRAQIVVAASGPENVDIRIFDVVDGFSLLERAQFTLGREDGEGWERVKIAAGDFDSGLRRGDGVDEIALLVDKDDPWPTPWDRYRVQLFDVTIGGDGGWEIAKEGGVDESIEQEGDYAYSRSFSSMDMTTGDFNADGNDEIFVAAVSKDFEKRENPPEFKTTHTWYRHVIEPDDLSQPIPHKMSGDLYTGDWLTYQVPELGGVLVGAGNLDGNPDNGDEIVAQWAVTKRDSTTHLSFRGLRVYSVDPDSWTLNWRADPHDYCIGCNVDLLVDKSGALAVGDFDRDAQDEIAVSYAWRNTATEWRHTLQVFKLDCPNGVCTITPKGYYWAPTDAGDYRGLAAGSFTGGSVRVGPPSYRVQTQMTSPEVFLNLPPMHRDILSEHGEIQIFNGAKATHSAGNTVAEKSTAESKRDWALSIGLETSVGSCGSTVSASLGNTYGENFSKSMTEINTIAFEDATTAEYYDQVIYNGTDYAIWEYPVLGVPGNGQDEAHAISVVFPLVETTNQPVTEQGRLCDEDFYAPNHQTYNVWSYDPLGTAEDFDDYHSLIESKQTSGGTDFSVSMSAVQDESRSASFHNQVSAGLEYSYENELNVPLIGKVWDFSFRAHMDGSYGHKEMSTLRTSFTEGSAVGVDFPSASDPSNYATKAYLYWAEAGYLVMDYQTQPSAAGSWLLYTKPDPAFILPWYGFPDPDTGVFPPPPDPDAPPCGFDKQLFTHDIELDPSYVQNGDTVTMTATVRNFSNVNPDVNVTVAFYLGDPVTGSPIGSCTMLELDRDLGPQSCSDTWTVSGGSGEEKVYAVIDPGNDFDEMHDADDVIDNNVGYGLLYVASADYFDPGLRQTQAYQAIPHDDAPGLGFHVYLPTKNISETVRYELVPTSSGDLRIVGNPIQVLAFRGGEEEPEEGHTFGPIPAVIMALYRDSDLLPGMDEGNLKLYRLDGSGWVEATCPGYQVHRFPEDNLVAVPVCQTGTFFLSDESPTQFIFLPVVLRSH